MKISLAGLVIALLSMSNTAECGITPQLVPTTHCSEDDLSPPFEQHLSELKQKLNLTQSQIPLWNEWSSQFTLAHALKMQAQKDEETWRHEAAPTRQVKWMAFVEKYLHAMQESLPSLKSLYDSFSNEQKKQFDKEVPFKPRHRGTKDTS